MSPPQSPVSMLPPPPPPPSSSLESPIIIRPGADCVAPLRAELPETSVAFCHPGYEAPFNTLFSLPRVESALSRDSWGVHYLTALTACQIIANNAFHGYLAEQPDGPQIAAHNDTILTRNQYFFVVPEKPIYAIVPSFQEWQFPGSALVPQAWRDAVATTRASDTRVDGRCAVTGRFTVELAHLSPREDKTWFLNNAMTLYDPHSASSPSDCPSNRIQLDCSLHAAMDKRLWAFAPRHGRFAVQTISLPESLTYDMLSEFVHEYHGRHMRRIHETRVEYLFARFAWAILYLVKGFILMGRPKTTLARYRVWEDGVPRVKEQGLPAKDVDMFFGGGGTRSASPRKRSRTSSEQGRGSDREAEDTRLQWGQGLCANWNDRCRTRTSTRNRKRTRKEYDSGSDCEHEESRIWGEAPCADWNCSTQATHEPTVVEERGRKKTREEDDVRYGKRRRVSMSNASGSVPSLAEASYSSSTSISSISTSPKPGVRLRVYTRPKEEEEH